MITEAMKLNIIVVTTSWLPCLAFKYPGIAPQIPPKMIDAITARGLKDLKTLIDAIKNGYKSYIVFLVQIQGMKYFKIANDIDNEYYQNYLIAKKAGVNFLAYRCKISPKEIRIEKKLKIIDE